MQIKILERLDDITAQQWNSLAGEDNPFLRHEFLSALEHHGCVGETFGWLPRHICIFDDNQQLTGAVPLYIKNNSYGEFVFDWAWAEAYQSAGLSYYPKAVVSIPYTPASGPRLLIADTAEQEQVAATLMQTALELAQHDRLSSLHWLFPTAEDTDRLEQQGYMRRLGVQFHWHNRGYHNFDDFLNRLTTSKRKKIKRERRRVKEAGIELRIIHGDEATEEQWHIAHHFYASTFDRKFGYATLNLDFFREIGRTMDNQVVLVFAYHQNNAVAGAINLRGSDVLYGRHWGCMAEFHSLHFEVCYYQGIEYCINQGLQLFEPGAQGEHKISRGFLPASTWSAHWIADPQFRNAISDFLKRESIAMQRYIQELAIHSPYKQG